MRRNLRVLIVGITVLGVLAGGGGAVASSHIDNGGSYGGVDYGGHVLVPGQQNSYAHAYTWHDSPGVVVFFYVQVCPWNATTQQYDCHNAGQVPGWEENHYHYHWSYWTPYAYGHHQIECCGGMSPTLETFHNPY